MPSLATLISTSTHQTRNTGNHQPTDHDKSRYHLTKTIYAVGIDPTISPKEKISQLHGANSDVVTAATELEAYLADPEFRHSRWFLMFFSRVRRIMGMINFGANEYVKARMAEQFIDELINDGYIRCLKCMAVPSGHAYVAFAHSYAATHDMPLAAALLFNPTGGARMALRYFLTAEKSHGQHRPVTPTACISQKAQHQWFAAGTTINWPAAVNDDGSEEPLDMPESQGKLPEGVTDVLSELWRRNRTLREYTGTNRLSGDIPFQIVEDAVDIILCSTSTPAAIRSKYDQIIDTANRQGIDTFCAVYGQLFGSKDKLRLYWDKAREMLHGYSLMLWEQQNEKRLNDGSRFPSDGVTFRACKASTREPLKTSLPGTIYLNNGRYYWVVRNKMKPVALVDDRNKRKLPGTIGCDHGRYFWVVPGVLKRQRLVAKGERFSTTDRTTAEKIALQLWESIQEKCPKLAARIKARRAWGTATKDRATAQKIARRMWKHIQQHDSELAATILTDNRPQPQEHWIAQICVGGSHRHLGSFATRDEAMATYAKEFERIFGYSPGYNVQCIPKLDKVWPTWEEEKTRLESMDAKPIMPIIGLTDQTKPLLPIIRRIGKVDWLVKNCMLVLDDSTPIAAKDIAIESRGQEWYGEIKRQGKSAVIYGCTSFDGDSGRIRIDIFRPAFSNARTLLEEVYHLVYRLIGITKPAHAGQIQRWYANRLDGGADSTLSEDEAFALAMVQEEAKPDCTDLPRGVVRFGRQLFSSAGKIPDSAVGEILTRA